METFLAPILSNRGALRLVHINEVSAGSRGTATDLSAAARFMEMGIDVCHVLNILCGPSDASLSEECELACAEVDTSFVYAMMGEGVSEAEFHYAISAVKRLMPLDLSGPFTKVITGQDSVLYHELSPSERWDFLMAYQNEIQDLRWDSAAGVHIVRRGKFRVVPTDRVDPEELLAYARLIPAVTDNRFSIARQDLGYTMPGDSSLIRTVSLSMVCADEDFRSCSDDIASYLNLFAQDQYHVRIDRARLLTRNDPHGTRHIRNRVQEHADRTCGNGGEAGLDPLPIKGGNYAVNGNLAFIGMDELANFFSCENWANTLGLSLPTTRSKVEQALVGLMLGGDSTGRVIWVGDAFVEESSPLPPGGAPPCSTPLPEQRYQPLYHIDLFFHPLGHLPGSRKWSYVIAKLDDSLHPLGTWPEDDGSFDAQYNTLKERMEQQADRLYNDLKDLGINPDPVEVPLVIGFKQGSVGDYIAFANGISDHTGSAVRYFMPDYYWKEGNPTYDTARSRAKALLRGRGVTVHLISDSYTAASALHCKVKVMKRDRD